MAARLSSGIGVGTGGVGSGVDVAMVTASSSWGAVLSPDGRSLAFISDRSGHPQLWVQPLDQPNEARRIDLADDATTGRPDDDQGDADFSVQVRWSADGRWLAVAVAPSGGVKTHVWAVQPDGTHARRLAGQDGEQVAMGPWTQLGSHLVITQQAETPGAPERCELVEPATHTHRRIAAGRRVTVLDLSRTERFALLREGPRGARECAVLDLALDHVEPLLPFYRSGTTDAGLLRPPPETDAVGDSVVAYLLSDSGSARTALLAVGIRADGSRGPAGMLAGRRDADLELFDSDQSGRILVLVWNCDGRSEIEVLNADTGVRRAIEGVPGSVVSSVSVACDGQIAACAIEGPRTPREIWALDIPVGSWRQLTDVRGIAGGDRRAFERATLVEPSYQRFDAHDGLQLNGWLYPASDADGRALIWLHGGPEAQERPAFAPLLQAIVQSGVSVFAPNVRGSSGSGRTYQRADDLSGRYGAIIDVAMCARHLVDIGAAANGAIACGGRSYGGYLTLAALVRFPWMFAAGIDVCGMSDLLTFFRDTEPWIAAAAVSKYGDPKRDTALLADLSPLAKVRAIEAPVLVVHGARDTNVPYTEATQLVEALEALGKPVELLSFPDEGHEYRRVHSRIKQASRIVDFLSRHLARNQT